MSNLPPNVRQRDLDDADRLDAIEREALALIDADAADDVLDAVLDDADRFDPPGDDGAGVLACEDEDAERWDGAE